MLSPGSPPTQKLEIPQVSLSLPQSNGNKSTTETNQLLHTCGTKVCKSLHRCINSVSEKNHEKCCCKRTFYLQPRFPLLFWQNQTQELKLSPENQL